MYFMCTNGRKGRLVQALCILARPIRNCNNDQVMHLLLTKPDERTLSLSPKHRSWLFPVIARSFFRKEKNLCSPSHLRHVSEH